MKKILILSACLMFCLACDKDNLSGNDYTLKKIKENYIPKPVPNPNQNQGQGQNQNQNPNQGQNQNQASDMKVPPKLLYYYQGINFAKTGTNLKDDLAVLTIQKHKHILSYKERHPYLERKRSRKYQYRARLSTKFSWRKR